MWLNFRFCYFFCEKASAEIVAFAQQKTYIKTLNPKLNFEF